jgi:hypothetical protein
MKKHYILFILLLTTSFLAAQLTYVPDDNFEQALIDLGYDDILDDYVLTTTLESIESLTIRYLNIQDLTGIEDCITLTFLDCAHNQIPSIDVSNSPNLTWLNCGDNPTGNNINITQNILLEKLICVGNQITEIDISNNINLDLINIWNNQLNTLDVSQNTQLTYLDFFSNQVSSIDLSNNPLIQILYCDENLLTSLNISSILTLEELYCQNNQLTALNIKNGNNEQLGLLRAFNNPELQCIDVDNPEEAYLNPNWLKDDWAVYSEDCSLVGTEVINSKNHIKVRVTPNPFTTSTTLAYEIQQRETISLTIYNHLGQTVYQTEESQPQGSQQLIWNAERYTEGVYYYRLKVGDAAANGKMVKVR